MPSCGALRFDHRGENHLRLPFTSRPLNHSNDVHDQQISRSDISAPLPPAFSNALHLHLGCQRAVDDQLVFCFLPFAFKKTKLLTRPRTTADLCADPARSVCSWHLLTPPLQSLLRPSGTLPPARRQGPFNLDADHRALGLR